MYKPPTQTNRFLRKLAPSTAVCAVILSLFGLAVVAPPPTGVHAQAEKTAATETSVTRIVRLKHTDSQSILDVVGNVLSDLNLRVASDSNTNSVILRGNEQAITEALQLIEEIDQEPAPNGSRNVPGRGRDARGPGRPGGPGAAGPGFTDRVAGDRQGGFYFEGGQGRQNVPPNFGGGGFRMGPGGGFESPDTMFGGHGVPTAHGVSGYSPYNHGTGGFEYYPSISTNPEAKALASEVVNLEQTVAQMIHEYRANKSSLDQEARDQAAEKIKQLVEQTFDKRLAIQELEVGQLEQRLEKVKTAIARRRELRDKIIGKRVDDLISDDDLRWDSAGAAGNSPYGAATAGANPFGNPLSSPSNGAATIETQPAGDPAANAPNSNNLDQGPPRP